MMSNCIEIEGLSHRFSGEVPVLNNIRMSIPRGCIYGFLGPNGAGKTTTLKLLLGLLEKQQGSIRVFGNEFSTHRIETLRKIGSLIESPSIYSHLTAQENLEVIRKIYECPRKRISEVLTLVGLSDTGKKKAGKFSLGMKQRLSIAIALLHEPPVLILDEPTNGLDPNGILEMRELLRRLNSEHNITIVISSHLLSEIEKLVSHVGIISNGSMAFEGTLSQLMAKQADTSVLRFDTGNNVAALEILHKHSIPASIENDRIVCSVLQREKIAEMNKEFVLAGIAVYAINTGNNDLESIFMHLTNQK